MSGISGLGGGGYSAFAQRLAAQRSTQTAKVGTEVTRNDSATFAPGGFGPGQASAPSAANTVDRVLSAVTGAEESANHAVIDLASGQNVNIPGTMVELEKADIALKYTVQLRNRALSAYEELMRMQV